MADKLLTLTETNARAAYQKASKSKREWMKEMYPDFNFERRLVERIDSYEAACEEVGIDPLKLEDFHLFPREDQDSIFASHQIDIIARALNGKDDSGNWWTPDYTDGTFKYWPYHIWNEEAAGGSGFSFYDCDDVYSLSVVGARHTFKLRDHAEYAGKKFESIYNRFLKPLRS